jgi:hypothetical protein
MIPWNHWPQYVGPLPKRPTGEDLFYRVGDGGARCMTCERPIREHPLDFTGLEDTDGAPFLRVLCNGTRVKL